MARRKEGLRRTAIDAKNSYSEYKKWHRYESDHIERYPDKVQDYLEPELGHTATGHLFSTDTYTKDAVERKRSNAFANTGAEFYKEHAADLHDLALIEAHIDGKVINVQQPLEIGQKTDIDKTA